MAEQHASGTIESARDWSLRLLAAGVSLLPVTPRDKNPLKALLPEDENGRRVWGCWTRATPTPDLIDYWFSKRPDAGIGVICGQISGGLQVLDIDDGLFARWLDQRLASLGLLASTWIVRTGSGKLHLYLRSRISLGPGEHKLVDERDGRKLADIRDEGSYVVAPPSFSEKGPYTSLLGAPERIMHVPDALKVWHALAAAYARNGHEPRPDTAQAVSAAVQHYARNVRSPAINEEASALRDKVNALQSIKAKRAILEPNPTWPGWDGKDWSDLDWRVIKEVLQAGGKDWSDDDFERVWATFSIGEHCYRNASRPNHGAAYLLGQTLVRAREAYEQERHQAESANGHNFAIVAAKKINYDPDPVYQLTIERTDIEPHKSHTVTLTPAELGNERSFILSVFRQANWIMQLQGTHQTANGFRQFLSVIAGIMVEEEPPEGATEKGQLWTIVRRAIIDRLAGKEERPSKLSEIRFGWHEGDMAYVSASALMAHLRQEQKHPPKPQAVWNVLEARGARSHFIRLANQREEIWEIRSSALV